MKTFKKYIKEDYEQVDNILDQINQTTSIEDALRLIKSYNSRQIGRGAFSVVYDNYVGELILKINSLKGTQAGEFKNKLDKWPLYIREVYKEGSLSSNPKSYYPSNPFYPKIYRMKHFSDGYIAAIERLNFGRTRGEEEKILGKLLNFDEILQEFFTISFPDFRKNYSGEDYFSEVFSNSIEILFEKLVKTGPFLAKDLNTPGYWLYNNFLEYNGKYLEDAIHLIHTCRSLGANIDVHFGNIGWRDNYQVVIMDPLS